MSDKLNNSDALDRAWRYYQHADNLLAGRINFFLVAESMLIVSFMTLDIEFCLRFYITILGLFYTGGWFVVNIGLLKRMEFLKKRLETLDPIYESYMEVVHWGWAKYTLTWVLPIATLFFWIAILVYTISPNLLLSNRILQPTSHRTVTEIGAVSRI